MQLKSVVVVSFLLLSLSQLLSGCAVNTVEQGAVLDSCMIRYISGAKYITSHTAAEQVVNISHGECQREFLLRGVKPSQQPQMSQEQRSSYEIFARGKIDQAPAYRFEVKRDSYVNKISVNGMDYVKSAGASENYYTKASLSARKIADQPIKYYLEVLRSGDVRAELNVAYFKGGPQLAATPIGGDVNCVNTVFCFWTEGAIVEVPEYILRNGMPLDFKLSGKVDSDPIEIPEEYIAMFLDEVGKAM